MAGDFVGGNCGLPRAVTGDKQTFPEVRTGCEEADVLRVEFTPQRAGVQVVGFPPVEAPRRVDLL